MTPKERILAALHHRETDYVPCCFNAYSALKNRCRDDEEYILAQLSMGVDPAITIAGLPVEFDPRVSMKEWKTAGGGRYPILHCEYRTPAGTLNRSVKQTDDWPDGDHIPFYSDHTISRATKHLITGEADLESLEYLLRSPQTHTIKKYRARAKNAKALSLKYDLPVIAQTGMHGDLASWLSGIEPLVYLCADEAPFVHRYLDIIERWNHELMAIMLSEEPDIFIRRGWYENADYWSPQMYREFLFPTLKRDADQIHESGALMGYIMSCSSMPLIDLFVEAGVDVLLGIDPAQDRMMDYGLLRKKTENELALWGGVCGYLTVECGEEKDVRGEVQEAIKAFGSGLGFILAPVSNVRADTERSRRNVDAMVDEWKQIR